MDRDGIEAAAARVRSTIQQAIRKITGETESQANGAAETATSDATSTAGDTKDAARTRPSK